MLWLPVRDFPGYEVSDAGDVRSWRLANGRPAKEPRLLSQYVRPDGYRHVVLTNSGRKTALVHRLVAEAFLPVTGSEINHMSGKKDNNAVSNLEWCSRSHNRRHAHAMGLIPRKRMTAAKAKQIHDATGSLADLARRFGVSSSSIHRIKKDARWSREISSEL